MPNFQLSYWFTPFHRRYPKYRLRYLGTLYLSALWIKNSRRRFKYELFHSYLLDLHHTIPLYSSSLLFLSQLLWVYACFIYQEMANISCGLLSIWLQLIFRHHHTNALWSRLWSCFAPWSPFCQSFAPRAFFCLHCHLSFAMRFTYILRNTHIINAIVWMLYGWMPFFIFTANLLN